MVSWSSIYENGSLIVNGKPIKTDQSVITEVLTKQEVCLCIISSIEFILIYFYLDMYQVHALIQIRSETGVTMF
jgi:hypothetical protein